VASTIIETVWGRGCYATVAMTECAWPLASNCFLQNKRLASCILLLCCIGAISRIGIVSALTIARQTRSGRGGSPRFHQVEDTCFAGLAS